MDAYDVALLGFRYKEDIFEHAIRYILKSDNPTLNGLVSIMADEIGKERLSGKEFMGSTSIEKRDCMIDARVLMARVLLDNSDWHHHGFKKNYIQEQLESMAYRIYQQGKNNDAFQNWMDAQRRYIKSKLDIFSNMELSRRSSEKIEEILRRA